MRTVVFLRKTEVGSAIVQTPSSGVCLRYQSAGKQSKCGIKCWQTRTLLFDNSPLLTEGVLIHLLFVVVSPVSEV